MNTVTFVNNGTFQITVKKEFVEKHGLDYVQTANMFDLINEKNIDQYFHNEAGPATVDLRTNFAQFWLNGEPVDKETAEKMKHSIEFNKEFKDAVIKDGEE